MSIESLLQGKEYAHGTRSRYVGTHCRCDACREANRLYYHEKQRRVTEKLADTVVEPAAGNAPQEWITPKGEKKTRYYKRACPGINGEPCEKKSHLRKDSKGGICRRCRMKLDWNGLVDATPARKHLKSLSRRHVGYKQVAEVACLTESVVAKICSGERKQIRFKNLQAILAVDESARADHAFVDGKETHKLIKKMVRLGYTRGELAKRLGYKHRGLQLGKRVLVKNAHKVEKIYETILEEQKLIEELKHLCPDCGRSHHKLNRQKWLKQALPATSEVIKEKLACFYGDGSNKADQDLSRDLRAIYAVKEGPLRQKGVWCLPSSQKRF